MSFLKFQLSISMQNRRFKPNILLRYFYSFYCKILKYNVYTTYLCRLWLLLTLFTLTASACGGFVTPNFTIGTFAVKLLPLSLIFVVRVVAILLIVGITVVGMLSSWHSFIEYPKNLVPCHTTIE